MIRPAQGAESLGRLAVFVALAAAIFTGCATPALERSRANFQAGRWTQAEEDLSEATALDKDRVLLLMERGTVRQARHAWQESTRDFLDAAAHIEKTAPLSITKDSASLLINDTIQNYLGAPYERTLLHAFTAKNYLARSDWDEAAVEARLIIRSLAPEAKGDYPDDAYSRYMAGFCLEMIDDNSNAALQYRKAAGLLKNTMLDENTGRFWPRDTDPSAQMPPVERWPAELVCFVLSGQPYARYPHSKAARRQADFWTNSPSVHAEICANGKYLGRSFTLTDTTDLAFTTEQIEAAKKAVKTITRVAIKEGIASAVENEALGELIRFVLIGLLEEPDSRRWGTLPRWLGVARVPCPPDLQEFDVTFKSRHGTTLRTVRVTDPIARHGNVFFSFCRDIVPIQEGVIVPSAP